MKKSLLCVLGFHDFERYYYHDPVYESIGGDLDPNLRRRCKRLGCNLVEEFSCDGAAILPSSRWEKVENRIT